jgi:hypothetical protein
MLEPTVFSKVHKEDYSVIPFEANKQFDLNVSDLSSQGYSIKKAQYYKDPLAISASLNSVRNAPTSSDGSYNYQNWRTINHLYYRSPYSPVESFEGHIQDFTDKLLFVTASIISAPYMDIGDGFRKSSITIKGNNLDLYDDSNYNLIDRNINTSSFVDNNYLDAYLGFQDLYKFTKYGRSNSISNSSKFISNTNPGEVEYTFKNIGLSEGVEVDGTGSGAKIDFVGTSYLEIKHNEQLSYEKDEDFTISFWIKAPVSQSNVDTEENSILTKRTYSKIDYSGIHNTQLENGSITKRNYISSSIDYSPAPFYPYDIAIKNQTSVDSGKVIFRRSDGLNILTLSTVSPINDGIYHHFCVTKSGSLFSTYLDGVLESTGSELGFQSTNASSIIFGGEDKRGTQQFSGSLDEIRFYSKAANITEISSSLAENTNGLLYQTNRVGNVFYRRGEIILTSPIEKYHNYFDTDNWNLKYKNKYSIYEYETLVRVKKGMFNKTMNPSSTQSPKSNLYLNDFTGSLSPYATTVGLYNKDYQLVAVGKLGRPLKMRDDVDVNIIVRWDY